jgi:hypothetical protein
MAASYRTVCHCWEDPIAHRDGADKRSRLRSVDIVGEHGIYLSFRVITDGWKSVAAGAGVPPQAWHSDRALLNSIFTECSF